MKNKFKQFLPALFVVVISIISVFISRNIFSSQSVKYVFMTLCDAFFVSFAFLCGIGVISLISTTGMFDVFGYGFKSLVYLFSPNKRAFEERKKFYDYKIDKENKRKPWLREFVILGLICLFISIIFMAIYSLL